jgi:hypothetical protein
MLEHASGHRPDIIEGRFIIEARHAGQPWEVIVEPEEIPQLLAVITASPVEHTATASPPVGFEDWKVFLLSDFENGENATKKIWQYVVRRCKIGRIRRIRMVKTEIRPCQTRSTHALFTELRGGG